MRDPPMGPIWDVLLPLDAKLEKLQQHESLLVISHDV